MSKHGPKITTKRSQNDPKMAPKWAPGGPKIAPWRPPGGLWRPWGGWGGPSRIFQRFRSPFGGPFGAPQSSKHVSEFKPESSIAVYHYFWSSGSLRGHFWGSFWGHCWVPFEVPSREAGFLKNLQKLVEKQRFLRFRGAENRSNIGPETVSSRNRAAGASREAPGIDFGAIWGPVWVPKSVRKGVPTRAGFLIAF